MCLLKNSHYTENRTKTHLILSYTYSSALLNYPTLLFSIFSIFLNILIIVIRITVVKVLISFLQNTGRPWDLFIVSGYLFLFLFMCSGHPWQFFIACWTWCIKNKFVDMTHPVMIYSFKEESLSLCCANRGVVESSNPIKILLKWGWFEALISPQAISVLSLALQGPYLKFWYDLWGPSLSKSQTLNLFLMKLPNSSTVPFRNFQVAFSASCSAQPQNLADVLNRNL